MHILSKLCLGLALILGFVGTYVATQVAKKRNAIAETVVAEKKKRDANIEQLSTLKITRQRELDELNRLQADWGRQWSAKGVTDPANATVLVNVGLPQGFGVQVPNRPEEVVHLFIDQAEGTRYLGEFKVTGRGAQTALTLNRKPFGGELQSWPQQEVEVRVRERIPPGIRAIFHDYATNLTVADQIVVNETAKLQIQENHIAASQKTLDRRLAELNGDPAAPPNADREIVSGLVDTIRVEEAQRNAVLKDVDALRRELSDRYARLERVLAENKQAVDSLATGTETAATPARAAN
jgi:Skp family chaperone for outer membrane proteins